MDIKWDKTKISALTQSMGRAGMDTAGEWLEGFIKKSYGTSPSPTGGPPGSDIGRLRASTAHLPNDSPGIASEKVGAGTEYAARQEFGFHGTDSLGRNINQGERPYIRPAVHDHPTEIGKAFVQGAKKALT